MRVFIFKNPETDNYTLSWTKCTIRMAKMTFLNTELTNVTLAIDSADVFVDFLKKCATIDDLTLDVHFYYKDAREFTIEDRIVTGANKRMPGLKLTKLQKRYLKYAMQIQLWKSRVKNTNVTSHYLG